MSGGVRVSLRALQRNEEMNSSVIVFPFFIASTVAALVPSALYWKNISGRQSAWLLLAGACSAAAQYTLTGVYRYAPPRDSSIYDCTQILFFGSAGLVAVSLNSQRV